MAELTILAVTNQLEWDEYNKEMCLGSVYTSWGWGDYKKKQGRDICRLKISNDKGGMVGLAQPQIRKIPLLGFRIIHLQGGIALDSYSKTTIDEILLGIHSHFKCKKNDVVIFDPRFLVSEENQVLVEGIGYHPFAIDGMRTMLLNTDSAENELMQNLSSNWRHNLKRANKKDLEVLVVDDNPERRMEALTRLNVMYTGLSSRKDFSQALNISDAAEYIARDLQYIIIEIKLEGEVIASRVGYFSKNLMLDFLAASGPSAKKNYANYLALWTLIQIACEKKIRYFDCGGIQPRSNPGVYAFKRGLGGNPIISNMQWIYSQSNFMKKLYMMYF